MSFKIRPGRCWACGEAHLAVGDPAEHIVESALGGSLTTDRFAGSCNRELGRRIDQPFLRDFLVTVSRARHGIRDPRRPHRPPPNPRHRAETPQGQPVVFDWRDGGMFLPPHIYEDEKRVIVTAETEEEAHQVAETRIARMRRRGQEFKPSPMLQREKPDGPTVAHMTLSLSSTIRARVAAKIALGAFSLVLPEDWLDTEAAKLLQSWMWDKSPKTAEGGAIFASPKKVPAPISTLCRPPEHLLLFLPGHQADTKFGISLFGEEFMVVSAGPVSNPAPETGWRLDPIANTYKETTFPELVMRARQAFAAELAHAE